MPLCVTTGHCSQQRGLLPEGSLGGVQASSCLDLLQGARRVPPRAIKTPAVAGRACS